MKTVYILVAEGFEEIEAVTPADLLRRAGVDCKLVSVTGQLEVAGAHGIVYRTDMLFEEGAFQAVDGIILPGGMPGTIHLQEHEGVKRVITEFYEKNKVICAICAAPMILGQMGLLKGRVATIYPGMEEHLHGATLSQETVCIDKNIVTSRAPGTAFEFALKLIEVFVDKEKKEQIKKETVYYG
ncbi:MAG: DJ-1/PfpI family protein [Epulopiscium sp.]|jgi:4-methyl-5(b-hydroxyethyl)-thiazole monophosphate biosynthesis|nr:DJ-1/PfpI family protein [Candidatus Epulonipiscium sp.]